MSVSLFRLGERNFGPRNRRVLRNFFVHQFFHFALLLRCERRARKIERQFVRANVASLLRRIARDNFVQRPMQQMGNCVMPLNRTTSLDIDRNTNRFARFGRPPFR